MSTSIGSEHNELLLRADRIAHDQGSSGGGEVRTLLDLLIREKKMDDGTASATAADDRRRRSIGRWDSLKRKLASKGIIGCCGVNLSHQSSNGPATVQPRPEEYVDEDDGHNRDNDEPIVILQPQPSTTTRPFNSGSNSNLGQENSSSAGSNSVADSPTSQGMNLAAALAAERQLRQVEHSTTGGINQHHQQQQQNFSDNNLIIDDVMGANSMNDDGNNINIGVEENSGGRDNTVPSTPSRVSLMRLMAEAMDGYDEYRDIGGYCGNGNGSKMKIVLGNDSLCCVCMERNKGAAFIPCGHTFCRVCTRELWLNRGTCPLCNRPILEILDIF